MPTGSKFWTVFSIFDPAGNLNKGWWRLPLYECPTNLNIQMTQVPQMKACTETELTLRIGEFAASSDQNFRADQALYEHYKLAPYHRPFEAKAPSSLRDSREVSVVPMFNNNAQSMMKKSYAEEKKTVAAMLQERIPQRKKFEERPAYGFNNEAPSPRPSQRYVE